jgi:hypothetical protein
MDGRFRAAKAASPHCGTNPLKAAKAASPHCGTNPLRAERDEVGGMSERFERSEGHEGMPKGGAA